MVICVCVNGLSDWMIDDYDDDDDSDDDDDEDNDDDEGMMIIEGSVDSNC